MYVDHARYRSYRMPAKIDYRKSQAWNIRDIDWYDIKGGVSPSIDKK